MSERRDHWEAVYRDKTDTQLSWHQADPGPSIALIVDSGIDRGSAIIDVGGGTSRLAETLVLRGFSDVSVLDISPTALSRSARRLGDAAGSVAFIEGDVTRKDLGRTYALWHDRAVFHFLTDETDRLAYRAALLRGLEPGGHLLLATFAVGGPSQCSGLDTVQYDEHRLQKELGPAFDIDRATRTVHVTPWASEQDFVYFACRRNAAT